MSFREEDIFKIAWDMASHAKAPRHPTPADEHEAQEHFGCDFTTAQLDFFRDSWRRCSTLFRPTTKEAV